MRFPLIALIVLLCVDLAVDAYIYYVSLKNAPRRWRKLHLWSSVALFVFFMALVGLAIARTPGSIKVVFWGLYAYLSVYIAKFIAVLFDAVSRVPMLWRARQIKPLMWAGVALGVLVCCLMWWGSLVNRFRLQVNQVSVEVENLPPAFDGYRIVQISDMHVGSFGADTAFVSRIVERVNSLHPDLIVFTGDIVNMNTGELPPFVPTLSRLAARDGVFSVLGNHDYGDYSMWPSAEAKSADHQQLIDLEGKMGWHLLNNSHRAIVHDTDTLMLIGVENIGDPPFHTYGNLHQAYGTPSDAHTKVLLSHNPAHWADEIADNDTMNIALTLAGHTHAMQIDLWGVSPASMRYKTWGGLYYDSHGRRPLYVNIGTGTVGIPARIGATPEITVITLKPAPAR